MTINERIARVLAQAEDAYSRDRYTPTAWRMIARQLIKAGATEAEAAWVLRSKHMRWAADNANRSSHVTAQDFGRYLPLPGVNGLASLIEKARRELTGMDAVDPATGFPKEPSGADLAGACEGEQIAALIDLAMAVAKMTPSGYRPLTAQAQALVAEIKGRR